MPDNETSPVSAPASSAGSGGKSNKTLMIVIIVVAVIVLAGLAWYFLIYHRTVTVTGDDGNTVTYTKNGDSATVSNASGDYTVGTNVSVPSNFPKDIPFYAKVNVTSVITANDDFGYTATSNDAVATIIAWYKSELVKDGWTIDIELPTGLNISKGDLSGGVNVLQGTPTNISFSTMKKTAIPYTDADGNSITYDQYIQQQRELLNSVNR